MQSWIQDGDFTRRRQWRPGAGASMHGIVTDFGLYSDSMGP
jgi:hypothetical protein